MVSRGILMPAYASQYVGMGKELYDEFRVIQEYFEEASDCVGINFVKLAFASSDVDVHMIEQGPLLLFVIETASIALLRSQGIPFDAVGGMDMVSWYSALHGAQALTLPDGLYLLKKWIEFTVEMIKQYTLHVLVITGVTAEFSAMVTALCEQSSLRGAFVRIVFVTDTAIRVTGVAEAITYVEEQVQQQQLVVHRLDTIPFIDVVLFNEALEAFTQYFEKIDITEPTVPIVHILQTGYTTTAQELRSCVRDLLVKPFRYDLVVRECALWKEGIIAIPALHMKERITTEISSVHWYTMETKADYHALSESVPKVEKSV